MFGEKETTSSLGHICQGGGATIYNSPINIHIHIHAENVSVATKIGRSIRGIFGEKHKTIEGVERLSQDDIQGNVDRIIQNR